MMLFRISALLGLSVAVCSALPAAAHPSHGPDACEPGMPEELCTLLGIEKPYEVGMPLPAGYGELTEWNRYGLDVPPPGKAYALIEGDIVLYDRETKIVLEVVKLLDTSF